METHHTLRLMIHDFRPNKLRLSNLLKSFFQDYETET